MNSTISETSSIINLSQFSSETDRENFNILRLRAELVHLISSEITLSLENFRKDMFLKYLISATCPLNTVTNETQELRNMELNSMLKNMTKSWQERLQSSLEQLDAIKYMCHNIAVQRDEFLIKFRAKKTSEAEIQRVDEYLKIFESVLNISKRNYEKTTSDYLILRHNGKMAQEVLNRKRLAAIEKQKQMKRDLEDCERDMTQQLESTDAFFKSEIKAVTQSVREDVMELEADIDELESKIGLNSSKIRIEKNLLKKQLKFYQNKYDVLQNKRKFELQSIRSELSNLREMIHTVEEKAFLDKQALINMDGIGNSASASANNGAYSLTGGGSVTAAEAAVAGRRKQEARNMIRMSEFQNQLKYLHNVLNQKFNFVT